MKQAIEFGRDNIKALFWYAVVQYMKNVFPAFEHWEKLEGDVLPGYQDIKFLFTSTLNG